MSAQSLAAQSGVRGWAQRFASSVCAERFRLAWSGLLAFFLIFSGYRGLLWWALSASTQAPFGFVISRFSLFDLLAASFYDLLAAAVTSGPLLLLGLLPRGAEVRRRRGLALLGVSAVAGVLSLMSAVHLRMMLDRGEELGLGVFSEVWGGALTWNEVLSYTPHEELTFVLLSGVVSAAVVFVVLRLSEERFRQLLVAVGLLSVMLLFSFVVENQRRYPKRILHNPVQYFMGALVRSAVAAPSKERGMGREASAGERTSLRLLDPRFVEASEREALSGGQKGHEDKAWNVLWLILESTGSRYIFEPTETGQIPMPFLKKFAYESWWMQNHHSTSNSSHRSVFSLFTGLYPSFDASYFCITPRVSLPTIVSFLSPNYDRFLTTPGDLRSYFPRELLVRSGLSELRGKQDFDKERPDDASDVDSELEALGSFLTRLRKAPEPFFGVYYSYLPHFHYEDRGEKYRVAPDLESPRDRYLNNLRTLDEIISKIILALKEQGRFERTVIAIVGDHGEAFGQHEFFTHANDSHQEQLMAPWILRVPGASPRVISEVTSHVDVLPTLLDVLELPYEEQLIQGESLLRKERQRKYIFAVGNEETRTSIAQDGVKLQQLLRRDRCRVYDLQADPQEETPLSCERRPEQHHALADFSRHQAPTLSAYSQSFWKGEDSFGGKKHPQIQAPLSAAPR